MDIRIVDLHDTIMCQVPKQPSRYGCRHEALLEVFEPAGRLCWAG